MGAKKGQRLGGIYSLEDLRLRCRIDKDCGCWRWGAGLMPSGSASVVLTLAGKRQNHTGRRAALVLAGVKPEPGDEAIALEHCEHADCVNPAHSRFGSRAERNNAMAARGVWSDAETRARLMVQARANRKLTDEQRLEAACSTEPGSVLAQRWGVSKNCISLIRLAHRRTPVASVFEWRG